MKTIKVLSAAFLLSLSTLQPALADDTGQIAKFSILIVKDGDTVKSISAGVGFGPEVNIATFGTEGVNWETNAHGLQVGELGSGYTGTTGITICAGKNCRIAPSTSAVMIE